MENKDIVLSVKDLRINFSTDHGYVQAVRGVSFDLYKGETLCIVGESGSGKSVTSKAIMGILSANGRIMGGSIMYEGEDLTKVSEDEFHRIRGHKIGMIFQDPLSSLNPIVRIGKQITEAMLINNSRIKKYYNDLVSEEFVAYKNAETEYETGLRYRKERIKFLKAERKKEVSKIKDEPSMFRSGAIYTLKLNRNGKILEAREAFKASIKDDPYNKENHKIDFDNALAEVKKWYQEEKSKIYAETKEMKSHVKEKVAAAKENFDKQIEEVKSSTDHSKDSLKEKYKPLIKETKTAFKEKSKWAKAETKKYRRSLREKYLNDLSKTYKGHAFVKACLRMKMRYKVLIALFASEFWIVVTMFHFVCNKKNKLYSPILFYLLCPIWGIYNLISLITRGTPFGFEDEIADIRRTYLSSIKITKAEAKARALQIMKEVGISNPEKRYRQYPFEFSGGMRQRIVIAIALTANPDILICDEPTTALDVTIQAQILELINRLKAERNISCIFITHDLGVVANMADRVAVMYAGKIVEYGTEDDIFYNPKHPYTWALLSSIPDIDSKEKLEAIPGTPPNMIYPPKGDAFALRSKYAMAIDFKKEPPMFKVSDTHYAATWLLDPRAPKVEMPKIVKTRIENSLRNAKKGESK